MGVVAKARMDDSEALRGGWRDMKPEVGEVVGEVTVSLRMEDNEALRGGGRPCELF